MSTKHPLDHGTEMIVENIELKSVEMQHKLTNCKLMYVIFGLCLLAILVRCIKAIMANIKPVYGCFM